MPYDLRPFIHWILTTFEPAARLAPGHYARTIGETHQELYGTSDMACILYTLGALHPTPAERLQWQAAFDAFIDPPTGQLLEKAPTHAPFHNTAFALAAMNLLNLSPTRPLAFAEPLRHPAAVDALLASIDWKTHVYGDSHKGAGLGAIFALVPALYSPPWFAHFFARTDSYFDPHNGMMGLAKPAAGDFDQIGGTFHYGFLYEFFHRRMPFPQARIDAILGLQQADGFWHPINHYWLTLDAIYMLTRTLRYCPHRPADVTAAVRRALDALFASINSAASRDDLFLHSSTKFGRLGVHLMTATLSSFAEAQSFLGADEILTDFPLRLVLDQRPFI